jgi:hypothetical protein
MDVRRRIFTVSDGPSLFLSVHSSVSGCKPNPGLLNGVKLRRENDEHLGCVCRLESTRSTIAD